MWSTIIKALQQLPCADMRLISFITQGERDWPLTMQGVLGLYITPFLPALTDMLAIRKAKAGLKNWD